MSVFKSTESIEPAIASNFIHIHVLLPLNSHFINCPVPRTWVVGWLSTSKLTGLLVDLQFRTPRRQTSIRRVDKAEFAINTVGVNSGSRRLFGIRHLFELVLSQTLKKKRKITRSLLISMPRTHSEREQTARDICEHTKGKRYLRF